jgi:hypothetical protein
MHVQFVHFTAGATDPVEGFKAHGVRVVTLADGAGADETYVSCLHFEPGGWISDPPAVRDSAVLVVHGEVTFNSEETGLRLELSPGTGLVMSADDRYRLNSDWGAIAIVVESERLEATERGISTPERIWGQLWPGESVGERRRTLLSVMRSIWFRLRWKLPLRRRVARPESSGWAPGVVGENPVERLVSGRGRGGPQR